MAYINRHLEKSVKKYLKTFPVVGLTGPRQSGKSTLLLSLLKDYHYVTFDDPQIVRFLEADPEKFMSVYQDKIIFDEAQKAPEIFHYIKMAVDKNRTTYGKFVVTGSSQFALLKNVTESLAGRIGLLTLLPMEYAEISKPLQHEALYLGGYPELVARRYQYARPWYAAYLDTYLHKDVRALSDIGDIRDFHRFIELLAVNASQLLNVSRFANDLGVSVSTLKRWLSVLEASYIIFLLPPYFKNYGKRIVKSPKIYFYDTGLLAYLTGVDDQALYNKGPMTGSLFENFMVSEILKREYHHNTFANLYFVRTSHGVEVDVIIDRKTHKEWIEIKNGETFKPKMLDAMSQFMEKNDKGFLIYKGKPFPYPEPIKILSFNDYLLTQN
jgi:predicted AAA+ superfamily ATPase